MKTLWFKRQFIEPILAGEKRDTIRVLRRRRFHVGELVALSNGPRAPFATARVAAVEPVQVGVEPERLAAVMAWCGEGEPTRIRFDEVQPRATRTT